MSRIVFFISLAFSQGAFCSSQSPTVPQAMQTFQTVQAAQSSSSSSAQPAQPAPTRTKQEIALVMMEKAIRCNKSKPAKFKDYLSEAPRKARGMREAFLRKVFSQRDYDSRAIFLKKNYRKAREIFKNYCFKNPEETFIYLKSWIFDTTEDKEFLRILETHINVTPTIPPFFSRWSEANKEEYKNLYRTFIEKIEERKQNSALRSLAVVVEKDEMEDYLELWFGSEIDLPDHVIVSFLRKAFGKNILENDETFNLAQKQELHRRITSYCATNPKEATVYIQAWCFRERQENLELMKMPESNLNYYLPPAVEVLNKIAGYNWNPEAETRYNKFRDILTANVESIRKEIEYDDFLSYFNITEAELKKAGEDIERIERVEREEEERKKRKRKATQ